MLLWETRLLQAMLGLQLLAILALVAWADGWATLVMVIGAVGNAAGLVWASVRDSSDTRRDLPPERSFPQSGRLQ